MQPWCSESHTVVPVTDGCDPKDGLVREMIGGSGCRVVEGVCCVEYPWKKLVKVVLGNALRVERGDSQKLSDATTEPLEQWRGQ